MQLSTNQFLQFFLQFVVGLVSAILTGAGVWLTIWLRSRKELAYEVISNVPVLIIRERIRTMVEVRFQNRTVSEISEIIVKVWNSGNEAIEMDQFVVPLSFRFGQGAEVLHACIRNVHPHQIRAIAEGALNWDATHVGLNPLPLNKGNSIELEALLTGSSSDVEHDGHLVRVEIKRKSRKIKRFLRRIRYLADALAFLSATLLLVLLDKLLVYADQEIQSSVRVMFYAALFGLACTYMLSRVLRINNRLVRDLVWLVLTLVAYGAIAIIANK